MYVYIHTYRKKERHIDRYKLIIIFHYPADSAVHRGSFPRVPRGPPAVTTLIYRSRSRSRYMDIHR